MTKPNLIPEKIAILTQAKEEIRSANSRGLCSAIISARVELKEIFDPKSHDDLSLAGQELGAYVRNALEGRTWLAAWQRSNGFPNRSLDQQHQDRMGWIDWMIKCYREDLAS